MLNRCCNCGEEMQSEAERNLDDAEEKAANKAWVLTEDRWFQMFGDPEKLKEEDAIFLYLCPKCFTQMENDLKTTEASKQ